MLERIELLIQDIHLLPELVQEVLEDFMGGWIDREQAEKKLEELGYED